MKIVMSGATGFIGGHFLRELLGSTPGPHEVHCLTRSPERARAQLGAFRGALPLPWPSSRGGPTEEQLVRALDGADAVVHLAGEPVVGVRLTTARKQAARASRVETTEQLVLCMGAAATPPRVFLCGSAIGYYGTQTDAETMLETSPPGEDYLARLCVAWENAAQGARAFGTRVVQARVGIVLGRQGGALQKMALPIRLFVGGKIASGTQMVSWIHANDVARALLHCIEEERAEGPINLTAPEPVDNQTLTAAIGRILRRPTALPVPRLALQALFGEGAEPLVTGQRAVPHKLLELGFVFLYPDLDSALLEALGSSR